MCSNQGEFCKMSKTRICRFFVTPKNKLLNYEIICSTKNKLLNYEIIEIKNQGCGKNRDTKSLWKEQRQKISVERTETKNLSGKNRLCSRKKMAKKLHVKQRPEA
jgi:hypothetical protein